MNYQKGKFIYEERGLEGAEYGVMLLEDKYDSVDYQYIHGVELYGDTNSLFYVYESKAPKG